MSRYTPQGRSQQNRCASIDLHWLRDGIVQVWTSDADYESPPSDRICCRGVLTASIAIGATVDARVSSYPIISQVLLRDPLPIHVTWLRSPRSTGPPYILPIALEAFTHPSHSEALCRFLHHLNVATTARCHPDLKPCILIEQISAQTAPLLYCPSGVYSILFLEESRWRSLVGACESPWFRCALTKKWQNLQSYCNE